MSRALSEGSTEGNRRNSMAIYHCSVKPVQRSKGRSSVAAAAYRAREQLVDERQGLTFNYSAKDLVHAEIVGFDGSRAELWNAAEAAEVRKDATTAREYEVALPCELNNEQRIALVQDFANWLNDRHGVAVDFAIHTDKADANPHAHILTTTRAAQGQSLGEKVAREWSDTKRKKNGLPGRKADLQEAREQWATVANRHLEMARVAERIDHRSHAERGIDLVPSIKLGHAVIEQEKRGEPTERGDQMIDIIKTNDLIYKQMGLDLEIKHERNRSRIPANDDRAITQSAELRRDGGQNRAVRAEHGNTGRPVQPRADGQLSRVAENHGANPRPESQYGANSGRHHATKSNDGADSQQRSSTREARAERSELDAFKFGWNDWLRNRFSSAAHTVIALAEPFKKLMKKQPDPTYRAVKRQIEQMGCDSYQIGIIGADKDNGMAMHKDMTKAEILKEIPNLKRLNAQGNHIFIQPAAQEHNLILVDDISFDDIEKMRSGGHEPAVVVETSPDNYQAWVKVPKSLREDERAFFAKKLAEIYDADPNSAQKRHYGRLAGFTNQKPEHQNSRGHHPFALLRESTGQTATGLDKAVAMVKQQSHERDQQREYLQKHERISIRGHGKRINPRWERLFNSEIESLQSKYGQDYDPSRGDWMAIKKCLERGCDKETAATVLVRCSPNIEERKRTVNVEQYVNRTIDNAARAVELDNTNRIREVKESPSRDRGPELGM